MTKMYENPKKYNITSAGMQQQDILQKYSWRELLLFGSNLGQDGEQFKTCNTFSLRIISMQIL